jgi:hypothetical protein
MQHQLEDKAKTLGKYVNKKSPEYNKMLFDLAEEYKQAALDAKEDINSRNNNQAALLYYLSSSSENSLKALNGLTYRGSDIAKLAICRVHRWDLKHSDVPPSLTRAIFLAEDTFKDYHFYQGELDQSYKTIPKEFQYDKIKQAFYFYCHKNGTAENHLQTAKTFSELALAFAVKKDENLNWLAHICNLFAGDEYLSAFKQSKRDEHLAEADNHFSKTYFEYAVDGYCDVWPALKTCQDKSNLHEKLCHQLIELYQKIFLIHAPKRIKKLVNTLLDIILMNLNQKWIAGVILKFAENIDYYSAREHIKSILSKIVKQDHISDEIRLICYLKLANLERASYDIHAASENLANAIQLMGKLNHFEFLNEALYLLNKLYIFSSFKPENIVPGILNLNCIIDFAWLQEAADHFQKNNQPDLAKQCYLRMLTQPPPQPISTLLNLLEGMDPNIAADQKIADKIKQLKQAQPKSFWTKAKEALTANDENEKKFVPTTKYIQQALPTANPYPDHEGPFVLPITGEVVQLRENELQSGSAYPVINKEDCSPVTVVAQIRRGRI